MLKRVTARFNGDQVASTRLTLRLLGKDEIPIASSMADVSVPPKVELPKLTSGEGIEIKRQLIRGWSQTSSESILEELDFLRAEPVFGAANTDLDVQQELWLLKAIAQERSLHCSIDEIERTYHQSQKGKFKIALVLNNLAVIQARRQWCRQSLELFKESIKHAIAWRISIKAPFFNCALIFHHLHVQRLIFQSSYLRLLDELVQLLAEAKQSVEAESILGFKMVSSKVSWTEDEIEAAYKQVARYGIELPETRGSIIGQTTEKFFNERAAFLDPLIDVFGSFGDIPDQRDRVTAYSLFEKGRFLAAQGNYSESLSTLEMASSMDPDISPKVEEESQQISGLWRKRENEDMLELMDQRRYEKAVEKVKYLPDQRLYHIGDQDVESLLQKQVHAAMVGAADDLVRRGDYKQAELKYKALLQEDIDGQLRKHVSNKLAALMK